MTGKTHALVGVTAILPFLEIENPRTILFMPFALLGSLLPDIDADYCLLKSKRYIIGFSIFSLYIISIIPGDKPIYVTLTLVITACILSRTKHRTIMHSLIGISIFSILIFLLLQDGVIPFIIGYGSHLFSDSCTISGVPLFYPKKESIGFKKFYTGGYEDKIIRYICFGIIFIFLTNIF